MRYHVVFISMLLLAGCSSMPVLVERLSTEQFPAASEVRILNREPVSGTYVPLANLSVDSRLHGRQDALVKEARALGADALILMGERETWLFQVGSIDEFFTRPSKETWGIAIRFKEGQAPEVGDFPEPVMPEVMPEPRAQALPDPAAPEATSALKTQVRYEPIAPQAKAPAIWEPEAEVLSDPIVPKTATPVREPAEDVVVKKPEERTALSKLADKFMFRRAPEEAGSRDRTEPAAPPRVLPTALADPHYAVVEMRRIYSDKQWTGTANFMMLTRKGNETSCLAELEKSKVHGEIYSECIKTGGWQDKVFGHELLSKWYVTVRIDKQYEGATVIDFGEKQALDGTAVAWNNQDELKIATSVARGMTIEAQAKGVRAQVRLFSPKGEIKF